MQSPLLVPEIIPVSPSLAPMQFEEPYNIMERRKSSFHGRADGLRKGTEDDLDGRRLTKIRRESINPLESEMDKDGFMRPREFRTEKEDQDNQEANIKKEALTMTPQMRLLSPAIFPEGTSPLIRAEDRIYKPISSLNAPVLPVTMATPILSHKLVPPPYSPGALLPSQPGAFGYSHEYNAQRQRKNSECCVRIAEVPNEGLLPSYFYSPFMHQSPVFSQILPQSMDQFYPQQDDFRLDGEIKQDSNVVQETKSEETGKIGVLSASERRKKIMHYLEKRKRRIWKKKISYDCRKKVADKRLRIKGRFVTREQAYSLLGATPADLANNELLKTLINSNDGCSIVTSAQNMKIRNIQTLFSAPNKKGKQVKEENGSETGKQVESNPIEETKTIENHEFRVEILKKNMKDQIVEIKIESIPKKESGQEGSGLLSQRSEEQLPIITNPIFHFKRLVPEEYHPSHIKYHKKISCL